MTGSGGVKPRLGKLEKGHLRCCWKMLFCMELRYGMWVAAWTNRKCADESVRIFMEVERLHPLASLLFEKNLLLVKWEAMKRSMNIGYM